MQALFIAYLHALLNGIADGLGDRESLGRRQGLENRLLLPEVDL